MFPKSFKKLTNKKVSLDLSCCISITLTSSNLQKLGKGSNYTLNNLL